MIDAPRLRFASGWVLATCFVMAASTVGCGSSGSGAASSGAGASSAGGGPAGAGGSDPSVGGNYVVSSTAASQEQVFDVQPSAPQLLTVKLGDPLPTLQYEATLNGAPVKAGWSVDQGALGTVDAGPAASTVFKPSGTTAGLVKITAALGKQTIERAVAISIVGAQNGFDPSNPSQAAQVPAGVNELTAGGGVGGVGGEGLGPGVADAPTLDALANPSSDGKAESLRLLYPYDKTVFPRGLLAPNLMWRSTLGDADAIRIDLATSSGSFAWSGTFGRPSILAQTGQPFVRHPIPQDVWKIATDTAGGADQLKVKLTVAKAGKAYGPLEETWTIAPARLSGTIYYNSYGTNLAKNYVGAKGGDGSFGGAVLSIRAGDVGPALAAGASGGTDQCRVCHSVAANGSRLVALRQLPETAFAYDITPGGLTGTQLANGSPFPGLSADGSLMLTASGNLYSLPDASAALGATGLTDVSENLVTPSFAPDTRRVAFAMTGAKSLAKPGQKLVVMSFDPATLAFTNPTIVADYSTFDAERRPGWAAFFPDGESVVFHTQLAAGFDGNNSSDLRTRKGARAEISWTSATSADKVTRLDALNGYDASGNSYLPKLDAPFSLSCTGDGVQVGGIDADHADDVHLNYEPTVNPVASGGYAWVVFTSRRLYGSVAEIPPFCSDPRGVDLIQNVTPKKLWVAAVDVNGTPGTDASHPAFYLPGQELLAGNSRGFWALDPCKSDGAGCEAGDECCNGHCRPDASGALVCTDDVPVGECSQVQEACTNAADCCETTNLCVNGFCTIQPPSPK